MTEIFLKQIKTRAAKYCSYCERAPQKVLEKLLSWDLTEDQAEKILAELIQEKFVDESRFCRAFCHDKFEFNHWSRSRIRLELQQLKVSSECLREGLGQIDPERYSSAISGLASRKWDSLSGESDPWKRKNKTADYLLRKGFESDLVWGAVNDLSAT